MDPFAPIVEPQGPASPVDYPLPVLVIENFSWRLSKTPDSGRFSLRSVPMMQARPGVFVPNATQITELVFMEDNMVGLFEAFAEIATPEQKLKARAALSDVDLPSKPELILP